MIIPITSLSTPGIEVFSTLTESQLRNRLDPAQGIFIAESPKVIHVALDAGYEPLSLLCEERHITGDAASIIERCNALPKFRDTADGMPVYTGSRDVLAQLTGYTLTRGVLCAMRRPEATPSLSMKTGGDASLENVIRDARRIVVIDGVVDTTNIGAIFRSAAALGIDAVILTPNSCDPLNRRSVRVSMGSVFLVPWTYLPLVEDQTEKKRGNAPYIPSLKPLHDLGWDTAAMALTDDSISIDDPILTSVPRLAIVMGTEGDGLPKETISEAHHVVRIPMYHNVDSLNVAAAAAVAFWELRARYMK